MKKAILCIDAGGQSYKYTLIDSESFESCFEPVFIPLEDPNDKDYLLSVWHRIIREGLDFAAAHGIEMTAVSASCPGPFNYVEGYSMMVHKWPGIKDVRLREDFYANGLPENVPVFFCHDASALVLGEAKVGSAVGYSRIAGFIIGTGIGLSASIDNKLALDEIGRPVFSFWNRPYLDGIIEDYAASRGVPRQYELAGGNPSGLDAKKIAELAEQGDEAAIKAYAEMGRAIARVFAPIAKEYNFDCVVFGGRITNSLELFGPAMEDEMKKQGAPCPPFVKAKGGELMAMIGCASYAQSSK